MACDPILALSRTLQHTACAENITIQAHLRLNDGWWQFRGKVWNQAHLLPASVCSRVVFLLLSEVIFYSFIKINLSLDLLVWLAVSKEICWDLIIHRKKKMERVRESHGHTHMHRLSVTQLHAHKQEIWMKYLWSGLTTACTHMFQPNSSLQAVLMWWVSTEAKNTDLQII